MVNDENQAFRATGINGTGLAGYSGAYCQPVVPICTIPVFNSLLFLPRQPAYNQIAIIDDREK
jgi:hypothetical protein